MYDYGRGMNSFGLGYGPELVNTATQLIVPYRAGNFCIT
jgi:hypothetical protein